MKLKILISLTLVLLTGTALAGVKVDSDSEVDFSKYATFAWSEGTPAPNPLMQSRLVKAIEEQLVAKGLEKVESNPDLLVVMHASAEEETRVDVDDFGYGVRRRGWGTTTVSVRDITVGTLIVDLVDRESNQLAWRAVATDTVSSKPDVNEKKIKKAAKKMFKKFPPK